jgi:hypothetical protein
MAPALGKRKRQAAGKAGDDQQDDENTRLLEQEAQEILRRHFEAKFKPLPQVEKKAYAVDEEQPEKTSEEDSEWGGISDEEQDAVQIVEHTDAQSRITTMSKDELKSYMVRPSAPHSQFMLLDANWKQSFKPPKAAYKMPATSSKSGGGAEDDDTSEAANLKKDLALQRLLTESHLLESSTNPTLSGNNRHRATDLRIQALGAKTSILKQDKMPMTHRKGMITKQREKEEKRRREARENGIILEKAKVAKKTSESKRDRGVGGPGVGKFSGGMLKLSKKDISEIEGPKRTAFSKGGKGRKRGR